MRKIGEEKLALTDISIQQIKVHLLGVLLY